MEKASVMGFTNLTQRFSVAVSTWSKVIPINSTAEFLVNLGSQADLNYFAVRSTVNFSITFI